LNKIDKCIGVLGSTGSVGMQTLDVAAHHGIDVDILSADKNVEVMENQVRKFKPRYCIMNDESAAADLKSKLSDTNTKVLHGIDGISEAVAGSSADMIFNSITGIAGLMPTLISVRAGKDIALANKETLVTAGEIVMREARERNVKIIPVDSEHSAIFQSLEAENNIKRILLTCSGGPFFGKKRSDLTDITPEKALAHPTWNMGAKISIDSATLMNKGLEVIEAVRLFGVTPEDIDVVIHRESIIHSMVEYTDNAVIAQMSNPDMRLCIQYALTYPHRYPGQTKQLDLFDIGSLTFAKPDMETFTLLPLAYKAVKLGGIIPTVLNGANECAVDLFLNEKIGFTDIFDIVSEAVEQSIPYNKPTLSADDIIAADINVRRYVYERVCLK